MTMEVQNESSLRNINLLFLIVLVLQASNLLFLWMPQYVRLVLNEGLFVFLPSYLYLRLTRQPIHQRVRWRWPGGKVALLSLVVGAGLYPISAAAAGVLQSLLGYINYQAPADAIPSTVPLALLAMLAYAGMAPFCEEFLFRGVLQPAYERRGPRFAVLFVGFLFIVFHLSLLQGLSIILLAFVLGFINYRTCSLPASILSHFGANFMAALVITQQVFNLNMTPYLFSIPAILGGLVISSVGLLILARFRGPDTAGEPAPTPITGNPAARLPVSAAWPLVLSAIIYLVMIGGEVYYARTPAQVAPLVLNAVEWSGPESWQYELRNVEDTLVGEGECQLIPDGTALQLSCSSSVMAYEVTIGRSTWMSVGGSRVDQVRWRSNDGRLLSGQSNLNLREGEFRLDVSWTAAEDGLQFQQSETGKPDSSFFIPYSETPLQENNLLMVPDYTWPWQLGGIDLETGAVGEVARFNPYIWRDATQDMGHLWESRPVTVTGVEQVTTPAGRFMAWKVQFGDNQEAWYNLDGGLTVVKFFNGAETWSLK